MQEASQLIHLGIAAVVLLFVAALGGAIIWLIFIGKIDLTQLLSEPNGDASMSRFQLLIFTFVIALSFYLVVMGNGSAAPAFPSEIPGSVLALLGISASSYLVSKGIQFSSPDGTSSKAPDVTVTPATGQVAPGSTLQFSAKVGGTDDQKVLWSVAPAVGSIDANGLYTAPSAAPQALTHILITATSHADANGTGMSHVQLNA